VADLIVAWVIGLVASMLDPIVAAVGLLAGIFVPRMFTAIALALIVGAILSAITPGADFRDIDFIRAIAPAVWALLGALLRLTCRKKPKS
jgi:H+/Cl- antiporter ClcA